MAVASPRILPVVFFPLAAQTVGQTSCSDLGPVVFISQSLTPKAPADCCVLATFPLFTCFHEHFYISELPFYN